MIKPLFVSDGQAMHACFREDVGPVSPNNRYRARDLCPLTSALICCWILRGDERIALVRRFQVREL